MSVKPGDKVGVKCYPEKGVIGTVENVYDVENEKILIVKTDDNTFLKKTEAEVFVVSENEGIKVSEDEFLQAVKKVLEPSRYHDTMSEFNLEVLMLSGSLVCSKLHEELFGKANND